MEKKLRGKVAEVRAAHPAATVELWVEDEARLGLKPITRRQWARRGAAHRPVVVAAPRYQWLYLFGFVRPKSGQTEWLILPQANAAAMNVALAEFARVTGAGPKKQIVLVLDGAGFHRAADLLVPAGLHLFELPAYTPELSPAEHLWPPVREALANQGFADLDALEDSLASRCRQLSADQPFVRGLTAFHWWPKRY